MLAHTRSPANPKYRFHHRKRYHRRNRRRYAQLAPGCATGHSAGRIRRRRTPQAGFLISQSSQLGAPLVIAVNALNPFHSPGECDADVLWGNLCVQYGLGANDQTRYVRQPNGFWSSKTSNSTAGILMFKNADMLNMFQATASLYVNPRNSSPALPMPYSVSLIA